MSDESQLQGKKVRSRSFIDVMENVLLTYDTGTVLWPNLVHSVDRLVKRLNSIVPRQFVSR